jgi:hypothetical protein
MFRAARKKGYREFHPITSPLILAGAGFVAFWLAYGIVYFAIRLSTHPERRI